LPLCLKLHGNGFSGCYDLVPSAPLNTLSLHLDYNLPRSLCLHHLLLSHLYVPMLSVSTLSRDLFGFSLPSSKEKRLCSLDPSLFQKSLLAISLFHSVLTLDFSFLLFFPIDFFSFLAFLLAYQVSVSPSFLIFFPPIFNFPPS